MDEARGLRSIRGLLEKIWRDMMKAQLRQSSEEDGSDVERYDQKLEFLVTRWAAKERILKGNVCISSFGHLGRQ